MGVVTEQLESLPNAHQALAGAQRISFGDELKETLKVGLRLRRYLDARHARGCGRRVFLPASFRSR